MKGVLTVSCSGVAVFVHPACSAPSADAATSVPIAKFARPCGTRSYELRNQRDTSKSMLLVPLSNPKFANRFAANACELRVRGTSANGCQPDPRTEIYQWQTR